MDSSISHDPFAPDSEFDAPFPADVFVAAGATEEEVAILERNWRVETKIEERREMVRHIEADPDEAVRAIEQHLLPALRNAKAAVETLASAVNGAAEPEDDDSGDEEPQLHEFTTSDHPLNLAIQQAAAAREA